MVSPYTGMHSADTRSGLVVAPMLNHLAAAQGINIQPVGFFIAPTGVNVQPQGASIAPNLIVIGPYDTTVAGQVSACGSTPGMV